MSADGSHDKTTPQSKPPHQWSAKAKLAIVLEAATVPETELGAFLRRKALHEAQLVEWRQQMLAGLAGRVSKGAARRQRRPDEASTLASPSSPQFGRPPSTPRTTHTRSDSPTGRRGPGCRAAVAT